MKKLVLLIITSVLLLTGCGDSNKPFSQLDSDEQNSYVWLMAQNIVRENLKSPSSAKFPSQLTASISRLGGNKFEVMSYVDAENSFGVKIRADFIVTLEVNDAYSTTNGGYSYNGSCQVIE